MAAVSAQGAESPESTVVAADTQERYPAATTQQRHERRCRLSCVPERKYDKSVDRATIRGYGRRDH